jgi:hypothetical protein
VLAVLIVATVFFCAYWEVRIAGLAIYALGGLGGAAFGLLTCGGDIKFILVV